MNKLKALQTLSEAYWYVRNAYGNAEAAGILEDRFHTIRRSLQNLNDLRPLEQNNEGYNGRMPKYF